MTRINADWVTAPETQRVTRMLEDAGFHALFVGGCVRNALIGFGVSDIDIATEAVPEKVIQLAEAAGLKPVPTGIDHGTVTVVSDGKPHEVTTFRKDVDTDGRRAVVAFSKSLEEDARRRDFTMNALYANSSGEVIDPLGTGLSDLRARRLRFIDDAELRIKEDYLRILRFFRFHAWYGDPEEGLDADGLAACAAHSAGIDSLSAERIGAEMTKLMAAPDPGPSVAAMAQAGVLRRVLPGAEHKALAPLVHLEETNGVPPDPMRRLATLGAADIAARLRLSRSDARQITEIRDWAERSADPAHLGYKLGEKSAWDVLLLRAALLEQPIPAGARDDVARGTAAVFPIRAADLMPEYSGAELGKRLDDLERRWIASNFTMSKSALLS